MATISTAESTLDWTATGAKRVLQNARNLLSMNIYEAAFARTMGIDPQVMDRTVDGFEIDIKMEADRNFDTYMPELQVNAMNIIADEAGMAQLEVDISL